MTSKLNKVRNSNTYTVYTIHTLTQRDAEISRIFIQIIFCKRLY